MSHAADRQTALMVVRVLREAGFVAYFAGGCVRDMLMGGESTDYDVATDATPGQVEKLFRRVLQVGAAFGVSMVIVKRRKVEVTTFRSDASYTDGRRPDAVRFVTPEEDARRRDFTINGMFFDPISERVIDYVGGQADLHARVVRTIGRPDERFGEDYLRMLRAVRFATRFDFALDPATATAIRRHAANITSISGERILDELTKMLLHPQAAQALRMLAELDLLRHVLPELSTEYYDIAIDRVERLAAVPGRDQRLMLAGLLADLDRDTVETVTRRWGASNEVRKTVRFIIEHDVEWPCFGADVQRGMGVPPMCPTGVLARGEVCRTCLGERLRGLEALETHGRDAHATHGQDARATLQDARATFVGTRPLWQFKRLLADEDWPRLLAFWRVQEQWFMGSQDCTDRIAAIAAAIPVDQITPPPFVTGDDLKTLGLPPGRRMGDILEELYRQQQDDRLTTRDQALAEARRLVARKDPAEK